ncbi:hypothetical protein ACIQGO_06755 [Streptomyces shenzhenensis]|uniref:hypothetical protein n=1 Tax=Streptomyces shenzhenensis TaxID=943815 RepID=UPI00382D5568
MGRRTAWRTRWPTAWWWSGATRRGRRLPVVHVVARAGTAAVLCGTAALSAPAAVAVGSATGAVGSVAGASGGYGYAFAEGARTVVGAAGTADAAGLRPGETYRSSLPRNGKLYYRLELRAPTTAYVPVTAVPPAGAAVSASDGIRVSVQDANGGSCSYASARFGAGLSPRPVTALGLREVGNSLCQGTGTFYVLVERLETSGSDGPDGGSGGSGDASASGAWDLELAPAAEPRLERAGATSAPEVWDSASPEAVTGDPRRRAGGAGFAAARALGPGVWQTDMKPGQTSFYKVPVDWGQQVHATAELGSSSGAGGYVSGALDLALHNPVRGYVDDAALSYNGSQKAAALAPLPPVEYRNRYAVLDGVRTMRFAGSYYLVVHLSEGMADPFGQGPFGVTLRVRVTGTPHAAPGYAGPSEPRDLFEVTAQDRAAAVTGRSDGGDGGDGGNGEEGDTAMRALAVGGIGTGSALLLALGVWTVAARRRAAAQLRASAQKPTA